MPTGWPRDGRIDFTRNETLVALVIVAFCALATISDPGFLSMPTLTDLLRGGIVLGIFAVGALLVLISGGIDVSFTAVAAFTMYIDRDAAERRRALGAVVGGVPDRHGRSAAVSARSTASSSPASGCRR